MSDFQTSFFLKFPEPSFTYLKNKCNKSMKDAWCKNNFPLLKSELILIYKTIN
jgi:hypothetical protein